MCQQRHSVLPLKAVIHTEHSGRLGRFLNRPGMPKTSSDANGWRLLQLTASRPHSPLDRRSAGRDQVNPRKEADSRCTSHVIQHEEQVALMIAIGLNPPSNPAVNITAEPIVRLNSTITRTPLINHGNLRTFSKACPSPPVKCIISIKTSVRATTQLI